MFVIKKSNEKLIFKNIISEWRNLSIKKIIFKNIYMLFLFTKLLSRFFIENFRA